MEMKYNSLIEFVSAETMEKAIREYLDPDAEVEISPARRSSLTPENDEMPEDVPQEEIVDEGEADISDETEDSLDDILDEFEDM
jgi:hypothetical protein